MLTARLRSKARRLLAGAGLQWLLVLPLLAASAPTDILLSPNTLRENSLAGTSIGTLGAVDPDPETGHVFRLVAGAGAEDNLGFRIVGSQLFADFDVGFDYEQDPLEGWNIRVQVTDPSGRSFEKSLLILLTDDTSEDWDGDGFDEAEEAQYGTSDLLYDTDGDGVGDPAEVAIGTSPTEPNSWPQSSIVGWGKRSDGELLVPQDGVFRGLSSSQNHSLALDVSGSVTGWGGWNSYGQSTIPAGAGNVVAVAAGGDNWVEDSAHSLALRADGTVLSWGYNPDGKITPPAGLDHVVEIDSGRSHAIALRDDGTVVAWGYNPFGGIEAPAGLADVVAVAAGGFQCLALKSDGTVVAWGSTFDGSQWVPVSAPAGLCDVASISVGRFHALAVRRDGSVAAWGYNSHGQIDVPAGLQDVRSVAAGGFHSLALKRTGELVAWGLNNHGQAVAPAAVQARMIAAGLSHCLAVREDGSYPAVTSASSITGTPGVEIQHQVVVANPGAAPLEFSAMGLPDGLAIHPSTGLISGTVATPVRRSLRIAVKTDKGTITQAAWLGVAQGGAPTAITLSPAAVTENSPVGTVVGTLGAVDADPGDSHTYEWVDGAGGADNRLFRISNDQIVLDGDLTRDFESAPAGFSIRLRARDNSLNPYEQVLTIQFLDDRTEDADGDGLSEAQEEDVYQTTDTKVDTDGDGFSDGFEVANGSQPKSAASVPGGRLVLVWGSGTGKTTPLPAGLQNVFDVAAGGAHSVALRSDGTVAAWGANDHGQATPPAGLQNVGAVAAGALHSLALRRDGTLLAWGNDISGQVTVPAGLSGVVAIAAGAYHNLALKNDGTVTGWGYDAYGQATPPPGLTGVVAIAAGAYHSLALKNDGTLVAWGSAWENAGTVPEGLGGIVAIAAGAHHNLALKYDGSVFAWGLGLDGQTAVPAGLTGVTAITAGWSHSLALKSDGTLVAWGDGSDGQVKLPLEAAQIRRISAGQTHNLAIRQSSGFPAFADVSPLRAWPGESVSRTFAVQNATATAYSAFGLPPGLAIHPTSGAVSGVVAGGARRSARITAETSQGVLSRVVWCNTADGVAPTGITLSASQIKENSRAGTIVGSLAAVDPNAGDRHSYRLLYSTGTPDGNFFMVSNNWLILRYPLTLDFDAGRTQAFIRVLATDSGGNEFSRDFTLTIIDDRSEDADGDGLTQQVEQDIFGTSDRTYDNFNTADPDKDGVSSMIELAFNLNPKVAGQPPPLTPGATSGLPVIRLLESGPEQYRLRIEYLRRSGAGMPGCAPLRSRAGPLHRRGPRRGRGRRRHPARGGRGRLRHQRLADR